MAAGRIGEIITGTLKATGNFGNSINTDYSTLSIFTNGVYLINAQGGIRNNSTSIIYVVLVVYKALNVILYEEKQQQNSNGYGIVSNACRVITNTEPTTYTMAMQVHYTGGAPSVDTNLDTFNFTATRIA